VTVDLPEEVVAHLADIGTRAAERGEARHRITDRAARNLDCRPHDLIERLGPWRVDQGHRSLDEPFASEKLLIGMGDHVDDGIADADNVEVGLGHGLAVVGNGCNRQPNMGADPHAASLRYYPCSTGRCYEKSGFRPFCDHE